MVSGSSCRSRPNMAGGNPPAVKIGVCGEHGGDPVDRVLPSIGLDYVSCSPFRVPVARLAAAHAAMEERN